MKTQKIQSGSAVLTFEGTANGNASAQYQATLVFLGGNKATLSFKNGSVYNFQW